MCRFALYLGEPIRVGSLVTEPANSIIHQSFHSQQQEETLNGDGFGIAWYVPEESHQPAVFKDVSPAWSNVNLLHLARVTRSACILAHVRAATPGLPVSLLNCHPFAWERLAFMHNGAVGGFQTLKRRLRQSLTDDAYLGILGSTDTEHAFALLRDRYAASHEPEPLARLATALADTIASIEVLRRELGIAAPSRLNLAVTDGERAAVSRYISRDAPDLEQANSLYVQGGARYRCSDGVARVEGDGEPHRAVLVSSEPLDEGDGWTRVPPNHMVTVSDQLAVEICPLEV